MNVHLSQNGKIIVHKDVLQNTIEMKDIVFRLSKERLCVEPCIVVGFTEHKVLLNDGLQCDPNRVVVITEQIQNNGVDLWSTVLEFKYREYIIKGFKRLKQQK
ncbi:hypothetical protein VPHK571_0353 [Vibrio phage K571]